MKIGELSKRTGCPIGTIRFYEMKGVLPGIARSMSGHRTYSAVDLERLRFIMDCRANGMKKRLSMVLWWHAQDLCPAISGDSCRMESTG